MRYMVSGRPQIGGRDTVCRGGQHWPRSGQLVEVVETNDGKDPPVDPKAPPEAARRIGKETWEALKADKILISITPEGEMPKDSLSTSEDNVKLRARVAELEARLSEHEGAGKASDDGDEASPGGGSKKHARR